MFNALSDETKGYTYGPNSPMFRRNETWIEQVLWEQNEQRRTVSSGHLVIETVPLKILVNNMRSCISWNIGLRHRR
jgi:hypothetical protein